MKDEIIRVNFQCLVCMFHRFEAYCLSLADSINIYTMNILHETFILARL